MLSYQFLVNLSHYSVKIEVLNGEGPYGNRLFFIGTKAAFSLVIPVLFNDTI
jgi:hypothetical protein